MSSPPIWMPAYCSVPEKTTWLRSSCTTSRDWTNDRHHVCDDVPYGGGGGMVMKPEPIFTAVEGVLGTPPSCPLILLDPQGRVFTQAVAQELSQHSHLALLCGRYEGIDERVRQHLVTDEISIGDYVLSGGELPALVLIDAITRLIPGALGDPGGAMDDSHATGLLEYPHYTAPTCLPRLECPRYSPLRRSWTDCQVAATASPFAYQAAPPRFARKSRPF